MEDEKNIIILGAGVTGLQTALSFLTTPSTSRYRITIIAAHIPGDVFPSYSSPWAGGHWRSHATLSPGDEEIRKWDLRTYEYWASLLQGTEGAVCGIPGSEGGEEGYLRVMVNARMKAVGLGFKESRNYWGKQTPETDPTGGGLWWSSHIPSFSILNLPVERTKPSRYEPKMHSSDISGGVPSSAIFGIKYQSICINIPRYLEYLFGRVLELGASVVKAQVDTERGLEGVVRDCTRIFLSSTETSLDARPFALINCTGLSAQKFLPKDEARKLYPIRGQTVLVKGEASFARTFTDFDDSDDLAYVIPRPGSKTTILGGCKQAHNHSPIPDLALTSRMLTRIKDLHLADELLTGPCESFEIISEQVGFRPGRKGGPRVEVEGGDGTVEREGKVDGLWVVHSYGHAGGGYQASIGCAEKVVGIVQDLL